MRQDCRVPSNNYRVSDLDRFQKSPQSGCGMDPSSDRERISSGQNSDLRLGNANRAARPEVGWPSARQPEHTAILASVELYDRASGSFSPAGSMAHSHVFQTATLLNNGQVLVAAGFGSAGASTSADLFLPATQTPP